MNNTISISDVLKQGWINTKKHIVFLILSTFVYFVLTTLISSLGKRGNGSILLALTSIVVTYVFTIGMYNIALLIDSGVTPTIHDFKTSVSTFLNVLLAAIVVGFFTLIGFILIIIPGLIVVVRLSLTTWLIVDKKMSAWSAIKESWKLTRGYSWNIFTFEIIALAIIIISVIPFGLGLVLAIPFLILSFTILYKKIIEGASNTMVQEKNTISTLPTEEENESTSESKKEAIHTDISTLVSPPPLVAEHTEEKTILN